MLLFVLVLTVMLTSCGPTPASTSVLSPTGLVPISPLSASPTANLTPSPLPVIALEPTRTLEIARTPSPTSTPPVSPTPSPVLSVTPIVHIVKPGDTLAMIAHEYGSSVRAIAKANGIINPDLILAGQRLIIPGEGALQTPTSAPTLTFPTMVSLTPVREHVLLAPMSHDWQKWNNCAPTAVSMALSYYGLGRTQFEIARELRGNERDVHVNPYEIVDYIKRLGLEAIWRINGDIDSLMLLVSNGIPVLVQQWLVRPGNDLAGHYRVVRGYDRVARVIIVNDSYTGANVRLSYEEFQEVWRPFNRCYIPIYPKDREPVVREILGVEYDDEIMYLQGLGSAQREVEKNPDDAYAWFNLGDDYLALGEYQRAVEAYERAMQIGLPWRMLWYQFGPIVAYNRIGAYEKVLAETASVLAKAPNIEELHYERGNAYLGLGKREEAIAEYELALWYNPHFVEARRALAEIKESNR